MTSEEYLCYIIMPFSKTTPTHTEEHWTKWWGFFKNTIEEIPNCKARRSKALRGDIVREIIRDLYQADVVIADLTDKNPNVYWELGVRQSFKHGTITIAETRKHVASDMGMKSVLRYYPNDAVKNEEFIKIFKEAINDCLSNPESSDSHVLESITGRGSLYQIVNKEIVKRKSMALIMEYDGNKETLEETYDTVYTNIGLDQEVSMVKGLSCSCVEHLVTTRYLDKPNAFYIALSRYLSWVNALNQMIFVWEASFESTNSWFTVAEDVLIENFRYWEEYFEEVREEYL